MSTTIEFLSSLEQWRARIFYILHQLAGRMGLGERVTRALRTQIGGILRRDGMVLDLRRGTMDAWIAHPLHERATHEWIEANVAGDGVMIDCGAYCGTFSLEHRNHFDRIFAFEPFPANLSAMERNMALSRASNVVAVGRALSNVTGPAKLFLFDDDTHSLAGGEKSITVATTTLDEFLSEQLIDQQSVRLLKVDVEGAELKVLEGARHTLQAGNPILVLEALNEPAVAALQTFLTPLGYHLIQNLDLRNFVFRRQE